MGGNKRGDFFPKKIDQKNSYFIKEIFTCRTHQNKFYGDPLSKKNLKNVILIFVRNVEIQFQVFRASNVLKVTFYYDFYVQFKNDPILVTRYPIDFKQLLYV